jgi:hypothetical protein
MRPDVFKLWLEDKGCRFDEGGHDRGNGHASLVIKLGEKRSVLPLVGTHQDIDNDDITRILRDLNIEAKDMPGHVEAQRLTS